MRKTFFLCILGAGFLFPCFSQNMFLVGGEYNFLRPQFWCAGLGFNFKLLNEYLQNDFLVNFGGVWVKEIETAEPSNETDETDDSPPNARTDMEMKTGDKTNDPLLKFLFSLKDSFYFTLDGKWVGLRAGVFASFGVYGIPDFPKSWDLLFNPGGFVGISLFPKSLVSVVIDVCPGYIIIFRIDDGFNKNEAGFSMPLFLGIRFNIDKL
jgi:hypothetical protein